MTIAARIAFLILLVLWAGIIVGGSLIATPVKFQAPSLSLGTGLEIGRYTFRLLGHVEIGLLLAVIAAATIARPRGAIWLMLALVFAMVVLQRLWLLPFLDQRVSEVLAGGAPSFSIYHRIFAAMEVAKAALLILASAVQYWSQHQG